MDFTFFDVSEDDADRRLDKVLKCILESHNAKDKNVFSLVRKNLVKLNGKKTKAEVHVKSGDRLEVASFLLGEKKEIEKLKKNADVPELNIVFENEHLLIINKPAGLNVQPSKENGECLSSYVESYYVSKNVKKSLSFTPGPLHRIDRFTRGLVCFSMSLKGARWFSENLAEHKIKYIASDGYTRKGEHTINVMAFSKSKNESRLIEGLLATTESKYLKEIGSQETIEDLTFV